MPPTRTRAGLAAGLAMSLGFGLLFTLITTFEVLVPSLAPAFGERAQVTLRVPYGPELTERGEAMSFRYGRVRVGAGTPLSEDDPSHRRAFAFESSRRPLGASRFVGLWGVHALACLLVTSYLRLFGQNRVRLLRTQLGLLALATVALAVSKGILLFTGLPEFWAPLGTLSLWVALAFDRRTSFIVQTGVAFSASALLGFDPVFLAVLLVRGLAGTLLFFQQKRPAQMLVAGTLSGLAGALAYAAVASVFEGAAGLVADLGAGTSSHLLACVGGGMLSGLVATLFAEPAEIALGHVSRARLLRLTDLEEPLLRRMAEGAPGSWEHARAMANLAEASASAIGADALLTRVGAYYHDLGKTVRCKYFVENLERGEASPHEGLAPDESARLIIEHVVEGTKILRDGGIPEPVVEFAYTHHGTQAVEYFWHKCLEQGNPKGLTIDHFRYPGMKPQTKETGILMLVDSIEAASRTIWPPEREKFEEMIRRVVFTKLAAGQLDESGLSLGDLRVVTGRLAQTLVSMYHGRIRYPWQRQAEEAAEARAKGAVGPTPVAPAEVPAPTRTTGDAA